MLPRFFWQLSRMFHNIGSLVLFDKSIIFFCLLSAVFLETPSFLNLCPCTFDAYLAFLLIFQSMSWGKVFEGPCSSWTKQIRLPSRGYSTSYCSLNLLSSWPRNSCKYSICNLEMCSWASAATSLQMLYRVKSWQIDLVRSQTKVWHPFRGCLMVTILIDNSNGK